MGDTEIPLVCAEEVGQVGALVPGVPEGMVSRLAGEPMEEGAVERRIECLKGPLGNYGGHWLCQSLPCGDRLAGRLPKAVGVMPAASSAAAAPIVVDFEALLDAMVEAVRGEGGPHGTAKIAELSGVPVWALSFLFARFPLLSVAYEEIISSMAPELMAAVMRAAMGRGTLTVKSKTVKRVPKAVKGEDGKIVREMAVVSETEEVVEKGQRPDAALAKAILSAHPEMGRLGQGGVKGPAVVINIDQNAVGR